MFVLELGAHPSPLALAPPSACSCSSSFFQSHKFVVSNTVHPACPTTMVKAALDRAGAAPRSHSAPVIVALVAVAVAALMRRS